MQRVTIIKIETDSHVKPSDGRNPDRKRSGESNLRPSPAARQQEDGKSAGMEKPVRRLEGNKRCIMHVCETLKERQSSFGAHFYPVWRDEAGREAKHFLTLGKKTHDAFPTKKKKRSHRTSSAAPTRIFSHHFTKICIDKSCYFFQHQSPGSKSSILREGLRVPLTSFNRGLPMESVRAGSHVEMDDGGRSPFVCANKGPAKSWAADFSSLHPLKFEESHAGSPVNT